ncbi:hypothetical protein [Rubrivirga sp.]|uniref:EamA family transporter n=1 Tax=Rubrivirga sp. TaxID=1885344 RepID=UPI003C782093
MPSLSALAPLSLALVGAVVYHLSQKSVPDGAGPFVVIGVAYAVGLATCVGIVVASGAPVLESARAAWRPAIGVGLGVLAIEAGFLLAYRAGWPLSTASLIVNVSVAVVLLVAGLAFFGESLTARQWAGIGACLVGLALITSR